MSAYAELFVRSNFSFLRGASYPDELCAASNRMGQTAWALTDLDGLYGTVKAHLAAQAMGTRLIIGSEVTLTDAAPLVLYVQNAQGYKNLCRFLSESRLAHPKGQAGLPWRRLADKTEGLIALLPFPVEAARVAPWAEAFPGRFYVGVCRTLSAGDEVNVARARSLAAALKLPLCAHNYVHTHVRARQPLQDIVTAIREKTTVGKAGTLLFSNAERTLKRPDEMAALFSDLPSALESTVEIAAACPFTLEEVRYHFPDEDLPRGHTASSYLRELTEQGLHFRYPDGIPPEVRRQVAHELALIDKLMFPGYFLAIWDIVRFAREREILCQGRGSAANSAVCFALQITSIDPVRMKLLFERFISLERKEPPDIDIDFEHERREEVLQYVYRKHGRHRAGMVCEVICFRHRLAAREVGKALGLSLDQVDRLSKIFGGSADDASDPARLQEAGLSADDLRVQQAVQWGKALEGFPRHLSIHVGGFVITQEPLLDIVPVENAAMKDRTVVQWEKDDLNAIGILKVDLLGLGMLTVLSKAFELVRAHFGRNLTMATIPPEDPRVYQMLCDADAIGVFQVESRAQMNMLPRLKPREFYDLVIEIAIIRPGPILGDMVHPFIRRRDGDEAVTYASDDVKAILERTLGVPIFQEQAMKLAMVAAGFSADEADQLRRILTHKRSEELLEPFREKFQQGCAARGYPKEFADRCFQQFRGFSHYGFPESHSASFALIAYASAYLKYYYPAAFTAGLLNSQPMGFYAAHTLVEDARRHGVEVLPVDVRWSQWDCTLEPTARGPALRLGLRLIKGLRQSSGKALERVPDRCVPVSELARKARIPRFELVRLALAGAFAGISSDRREALWEIEALGPLDEDDLFFGLPLETTQVPLPSMNVRERVSADYKAIGLSLESHPLALLRPLLRTRKALTAAQLAHASPNKTARVGGLVICRQRPPTAKGFCFLSLEDETGISNVVVTPDQFPKFRKEIMGSVLLYAEGIVERAGKVVHLKTRKLESLSLS